MTGDREAGAADGLYTCPTPCDQDCEIAGWGCHEEHVPHWKRAHDADDCAARMLAVSLQWLVDAKIRAEFGMHAVPHRGEDGPEPYFVRESRWDGFTLRIFHGITLGHAVAKARRHAEREGITP